MLSLTLFFFWKKKFKQEEEERSESSPGALRDRVPGSGGGGRGSAPADSFHHLKPGDGGPHRVLLVKTIN